MITEQEKTERRAVVQSALASQRMENLEPDAQAVVDAGRWARGEMTSVPPWTRTKRASDLKWHEIRRDCGDPYLDSETGACVSQAIAATRSSSIDVTLSG